MVRSMLCLRGLCYVPVRINEVACTPADVTVPRFPIGSRPSLIIGNFYIRYTQGQLILMTQIGISILFGFGVVGLIVVYCKICNRTRQVARERRRLRVVLHEERDLVTQCSTIEGLLRDRPPSYNEVIRNASPVYTSSCAPPLYSSPYNRASMQEAPPSYPGTPKPQEKSRDSDELPSSPPVPPVAQHM
ncbi:uncharacterized protein LOC143903787 isoform X4 [Temnothorax americanus]|uniref:uncharacterized protein LOC143903787 isoform X4 n=1 Tax=Temnothorax americanus TaxID=1964332 RepID=UPI0040691FFB